MQNRRGARLVSLSALRFQYTGDCFGFVLLQPFCRWVLCSLTLHIYYSTLFDFCQGVLKNFLKNFFKKWLLCLPTWTERHLFNLLPFVVAIYIYLLILRNRCDTPQMDILCTNEIVCTKRVQQRTHSFHLQSSFQYSSFFFTFSLWLTFPLLYLYYITS